MAKWVAALLILANVGIYLWATGVEPPEPVLVPPPPVNLQAMRLLREQPPAARPGVSPVAAVPAADAPAPASVPPTAPAAAARTCLRIGPFMQVAEAEALSRELAKLKIAHRQNVQGGRQIRRWRVFLGPYPDAAALEGRRAELKKLAITDQYVKRESDGRDILSLGLFSQSTLADRHVQELRDKGVHPLVRHEDFPLGNVVWIDLTDAEANARGAESLRALRYPDARTALREAPCPAR